MKLRKPILIFFEGVDKTGKTTLADEFNRETNFNYVIYDRGTISSKVYDFFFNRNRFAYYDAVEAELEKNFDVLIVYCYASTDTIRNRLKEANEALPNELSDIDKAKLRFEYTINHLCAYNNVIKINTDESKLICLDKILKKVKEMEDESNVCRM